MKTIYVLTARSASKLGVALGLSVCVWGCAQVSGLDEFSVSESTAGAGGNDGASTSSSAASSSSSSSASSSNGASSSSASSSSSSSASSSSGGEPLSGVVIAEYYQSGSKSGALYNADYAVLKNTGDVPASLAGRAFQHFKTGVGWVVLPLPDVTLAPGDTFLIQMYRDSASSVGAALPSPNLVSPQSSEWNISTTNGEALAITNDTQAIANCNAPSIVDLVGFNGTAPCHEGAAEAPTSTPTESVHRKNGETLDTNQNGTDFELGPPSP